MGSIQQVAMAAVCLAAAFAFGSFINQTPNGQPDQSQTTSSVGLRSLIEPELTVQKRPANTPWMKPKLAARLPMPSLATDGSLVAPSNAPFNQRSSTVGEIPPPSDLTGRINLSRIGSTEIGSTQNNSTKSPTLKSGTALVSDAPSFDFGPIGESSMPVVAKQNFGRSPNLADSMRAPIQPGDTDEPIPSVENAPTFAVAEYTPAETVPTGQRRLTSNPSQRAGDRVNAPSLPLLNRRSQSHTAARPMLPIRPSRILANEPTISTPKASFETATRDQFKSNDPLDSRNRFESNVLLNSSDQVGLMPIPRIAQNQTVTIEDPGGAFGNRDQPPRWGNTGHSVIDNNDSDQHQDPLPPETQPLQQEPRVTRLPLQLNSNAKTKLTRLRDDTIQKISLSTTRFSDHVVERGDSLQSIATEYFGKPDFYLDIYLANRDRLRYPGDVREGMLIKIPVYE